MTRVRPTLLAMCDYYLPGYKAGGPIRTLAGLVEHLGEEVSFKIATRDHDLGDPIAYSGVRSNTWRQLENAAIIHLSSERLALRPMAGLLRRTRHDALYINSLFSVPFAIKPLMLRRLRLIPPAPVIIAPRGELAPGALAIHSLRKRLYLSAARRLGLCRGVVWQASSHHEDESVRRWFGDGAVVVIAPNLPPSAQATRLAPRRKTAGRVAILFLARISRMKNLDGALTMLRETSGEIQFNIYGPVEDRRYWERCRRLIDQLPGNISVAQHGAVAPDQVADLMAQHDLFFLPTLGENFGHVVLEALANGCPVLLSDRTRWRGLRAAGVGWDVALDQPAEFRRVLEEVVAMDADTWSALSERARAYAGGRLHDLEAIEQNRRLFLGACAAMVGHPIELTSQRG